MSDSETTTVKTSISSISVNPRYADSLERLVLIVNLLVTQTYQFVKFILLAELNKDKSFRVEEHFSLGFIEEAMDMLIEKIRKKKLRSIISNNIQEFRSISRISPISLPNSQQIVAYESRKIYKAYLNNIEGHMGHWIRGISNKLLKVTERKTALTKQLKEEGRTQRQIAEALKKQIFDPAKAFKEAICSRKIDIENFDDTIKDVYKTLGPFFKAYPAAYTFKDDNIYLDIKINPLSHMNAFIQLAHISETQGFKIPVCFPLRKSNIPCHITLDNRILRMNVMKEDLFSKNVNQEDLYYWKKFCNLECNVFSRQADRAFWGIATTDGVSISIVKQSKKPERHGHVRKKNLNKGKQQEFMYVDDLAQDQILDTRGQCVVIDPGRRDLLFCLQEGSTSTNPVKLRYTITEQHHERKQNRYKEIRKNMKKDTPEISAAESSLSKIVSPRTTDFSLFQEYLTKSNADKKTLKKHYQQAIYRKLKLSSYIRFQIANEKLIAKLKKQFGGDAVLIMGDWSAKHQKYHEPIRGVGWRRLMRKAGFSVYLMDEFCTSRHCPACGHKSLETFLTVDNPRPYQRKETPKITCHGLLRCTNEECSGDGFSRKFRVWNRDMAACLNFLEILNSMRLTGGRPTRFTRSNKLLPDVAA